VSLALLLNHRNVVAVEQDDNQCNQAYTRIKTELPRLVAEMTQVIEVPYGAFVPHAQDAADLAAGLIVREQVKYVPQQWMIDRCPPEADMHGWNPLAGSDEYAAALKVAQEAYRAFYPVRVSTVV
jgi:hypothetical protein